MRTATKSNATPTPPTAIAQAFAKAGVKTPMDKLKEIALSAMISHANDTLQAIEDVWKVAQKDAPMLVALFNPYGEYRGAIGRIFNQIKHDVAVSNQRGESLNANQKKALKIVERDRREERAAEEEQRKAEREEQARKDNEYREYLASWHKTPLWNVNIGEKPVWQVSSGTIRAWLPTQHKKLRALEMLIDGVPDDGRPLEYYRTPADVKEIWKIIGGMEEEGGA